MALRSPLAELGGIRSGVLRLVAGLALFLFGLQTLTGLLLIAYYRPTADEAYHSVAVIMDDVRLGWLIHSLHRWGSDFVILVGFVHLVNVYFSRAYQAPRQLNWAVGVVLLVFTLTMGFTGILLPWDQYAYWYIDSARVTISGVPIIGNLLLGVMWGGWEIGEEVLLRFYALHVGLLPVLAVSLLFAHLLMAWRVEFPQPVRTGIASLDLLIGGLLTSGVLLSVAILFPPALSAPADPLSVSAAQAPWYLLTVRETFRGFPGWFAAIAAIGFLVVLFLVPVLDRGATPSVRRTVLQRALGVLVLSVWILLGMKGCWR